MAKLHISVPLLASTAYTAPLGAPTYTTPSTTVGGLVQTTNGNTAHGRVTYFRRFELQIETAPNIYRQIHLHQGTIINPRGTTLTPGMTVDISGNAQGDHSLNADSIVAR